MFDSPSVERMFVHCQGICYYYEYHGEIELDFQHYLGYDSCIR
jgi:hypothetical protein